MSPVVGARREAALAQVQAASGSARRRLHQQLLRERFGDPRRVEAERPPRRAVGR